jgi:hypothetical protein
MRMIAILMALFAGGSATKPTVEFKALRKMTQLQVGHCDAEVAFSLRVFDGGVEDYYCPRVVFEWEDGSRSMEESDCVPFEQAEPADHRRTWTRSRKFQGSGNFSVQAHICRGERRIKSIRATATIVGWEGHTSDTRDAGGCSAARPIDADDENGISTAPQRGKDPCSN